ncbi:MAG: hypothetical protein WC205_06610 [Opitutaceae bacterium]|jgi:hypothetical protein
MKSLATLSLVLSTSAALFAQTTYTWDGSGAANTGGNWSSGANWSVDAPAGGPGVNDTAVLSDVTTGTRTVAYDSGASGTVSALEFNQTTAGAINLLDIQTNLTVTNAFSLGASAGTEKIVVTSASGVKTLSVGGAGLTLGANGELVLGATDNSNKGAYTGALTIAGGTLTLDKVSGAAQTTSMVNGSLTMSSGSLVIDNPFGGFVGDRRLEITGNLNITGGTVSTTRNGAAGILVLDGSSLVYNPTSGDSDLAVTLNAFSDQSLSTNQTLSAGLVLRGRGVKTVTSTAVGNSIGALSFIDGEADTRGTILKLGSNLNLASAAAQPSAAGFSNAGSVSQFGIDTNGFTLDLSNGASGGVWTPNKGSLPTTWTFSGNGVIVANAFNLNTTDVTTDVGSGLVLEARGGASTANVLSGTGTIAADSTFRYAGSATGLNPATLTSNRSVGKLEVTSGVLRVDSIAGVQGAINVSSGKLVMGSGVSFADSPGISLGSTGVLDTTALPTFTLLLSQTITVNIDAAGSGVSGFIEAAGLDITNGSISLTSGLLDDAVYVIARYTSLTGTEFNSINGLQSGYRIDYSYLGNQIALIAIPEPSTFASILGGMMAVAVVLKRRHIRSRK